MIPLTYDKGFDIDDRIKCPSRIAKLVHDLQVEAFHEDAHVDIGLTLIF